MDFVFSTSRCVDVSRKDVNSILSQPKSDKSGFTGAPREGFYLKSVPEYINCYMVITPSICEREIKRWTLNKDPYPDPCPFSGTALLKIVLKFF